MTDKKEIEMNKPNGIEIILMDDRSKEISITSHNMEGRSISETDFTLHTKNNNYCRRWKRKNVMFLVGFIAITIGVSISIIIQENKSHIEHVEDTKINNIMVNETSNNMTTPPTASPVIIPLFWDKVGTGIEGMNNYQFMGKTVSMSDDGSIIAVGGINEVAVFYQQIENKNEIKWVQSSDLSSLLPRAIGELKVMLSNDGQILGVGAPRSDGNHSSEKIKSLTNIGEARIFRVVYNQNNEQQWVQIGQTVYGKSSYDFFGSSLSFSNDASIIAIGATGGKYISLFHMNHSSSQLRRSKFNKIEAPFSKSDGFAHDISLSGDGSVLAVGAPFAGNTLSGSVFIYDLSWIEEREAEMVSQFDGRNSNDWFGWSVSMADSGTRFAVGAPEGEYVGVFEKFSNGNTDWELMGHLISQKTFTNGNAISLSGDGKVIVLGKLCGPMENKSDMEKDLYSEKKIKNEAAQIMEFKNGTWLPMSINVNSGVNPLEACSISVSVSNNGKRIAIGTAASENGQNSRGYVTVLQSQPLLV